MAPTSVDLTRLPNEIVRLVFGRLHPSTRNAAALMNRRCSEFIRPRRRAVLRSSRLHSWDLVKILLELFESTHSHVYTVEIHGLRIQDLDGFSLTKHCGLRIAPHITHLGIHDVDLDFDELETLLALTPNAETLAISVVGSCTYPDDVYSVDCIEDLFCAISAAGKNLTRVDLRVFNFNHMDHVTRCALMELVNWTEMEQLEFLGLPVPVRFYYQDTPTTDDGNAWVVSRVGTPPKLKALSLRAWSKPSNSDEVMYDVTPLRLVHAFNIPHLCELEVEHQGRIKKPERLGTVGSDGVQRVVVRERVA